MISISDFRARWIGKRNNFDGGFGPQCVDLVKQWESDNGWQITSGNANTYNGRWLRGYKWVLNNPQDSNQHPNPGDIVSMNAGQFGHVGICFIANGRTAYIISQCFPTPTVVNNKNQVISLGTVTTLTAFNYIHPKIIGWYQKI